MYVKHGPIYETSENALQPVVQKYAAELEGWFPHQPKSVEGSIMARFKKMASKDRNTERKKHVTKELKYPNLGSPASPENPNRIPLQTIDTISTKYNQSAHDEL